MYWMISYAIIQTLGGHVNHHSRDSREPHFHSHSNMSGISQVMICYQLEAIQVFLERDELLLLTGVSVNQISNNFTTLHLKDRLNLVEHKLETLKCRQLLKGQYPHSHFKISGEANS